MALASGTRLGPYEVVSALGAGGMGEVYRARDSKLNRDVALKVLPDAFALDPDRLARFKREAQVLASLNHPHVAAIYGFEDSGSTHALVLELVEGPTLAERIEGLKAEGKGLQVDEALSIAKQIAEALEAAHEQGVIHRDLKPANIKLRPDGTVKVLDFGLAKALEPASAMSRPDITASPTLTSPAMMTGMGMILGTAAYMSPEQAKGRPADKRSDIWAFGCVLYEMLTGARPFDGEDIADTLAYVLTKEPDWSKLPPQLPPAVGAVLRRCLMKDRKRRVGDIAAVRFALEEPDALSSSIVAASTLPIASHSRWHRVATHAAVLFFGVAATGLGSWEVVRLQQRSPQPVRFTIVPPAAQALSLVSPGGGGNALDRAIAISPDGTRIVYRAGAGTDFRMMVRPIDQLDAHALPVITAFRYPVISPDGQWIAFFNRGEVQKISVTGGPPISICHTEGNSRGLAWSDDGTLIYAVAGSSTGLFTVPAGGGEPKLLSQADRVAGEGALWFPSALPGSRAVLVTVLPSTQDGSANAGQIAVIDLQTKQKKTVLRGGADAHYVNSGHLVYAAGGALRAVPFDLKRLEVTGDPVPMLEGVSTAATGEAQFAVSATGTLLYVPGYVGTALGPQLSLVWVDRKGREEPINAPPRGYTYPRISPDGTRVALDVRDQENDIWIWDIKRETLTRLTFDPGLDRAPVWTPDGRRVLFSSQRGGVVGGGNIFWQAADGTGTVERLTADNTDTQYPTSISPDGTRVVLREDSPKTRRDVTVVTPDGKSKAEPLIQTTFNEENGEISPDGHWLVYQSDESGQYQIYVRPFPKVDGGRWQISAAGGTRPAWARNGRELFYVDATSHLMAVPVQTTPAFSAGSPARVFETQYLTPNNARTYDVSPDGQRFLMIKGKASNDQQPAGPPSHMVVVLNWFEELKQRVTAK